jgi:hypothetical protein
LGVFFVELGLGLCLGGGGQGCANRWALESKLPATETIQRSDQRK